MKSEFEHNPYSRNLHPFLRRGCYRDAEGAAADEICRHGARHAFRQSAFF